RGGTARRHRHPHRARVLRTGRLARLRAHAPRFAGRARPVAVRLHPQPAAVPARLDEARTAGRLPAAAAQPGSSVGRARGDLYVLSRYPVASIQRTVAMKMARKASVIPRLSATLTSAVP